VLNKIDLLPEEERAALLSRTKSGPKGKSTHVAPGIAEVAISAVTGEGVNDLLAAIDAALHSDPIVEAELRVPQHEGAVLAAIKAGMVVYTREYEGNVVRLSVSGPASLVGRMRRFRTQKSAR
jgi:GTP-binding protein HflX